MKRQRAQASDDRGGSQICDLCFEGQEWRLWTILLGGVVWPTILIKETAVS